jgi:hypothetical protein
MTAWIVSGVFASGWVTAVARLVTGRFARQAGRDTETVLGLGYLSLFIIVPAGVAIAELRDRRGRGKKTGRSS